MCIILAGASPIAKTPVGMPVIATLSGADEFAMDKYAPALGICP